MSRASTPKNPWVGLTYIADNPKMETPPAWFLAAIHDYDSEIVIFPSRYKPFAYVVARRSRMGHNIGKDPNGVQIDQPDTKMCFAHGCVPVCLMFKHGSQWKVDAVLASLRARDVWAHGGAEKVADMLDEQDAAAEAKQRADKRQELWDLSGEAWRSYQARTGQRVVNPGPSHHGAATTPTAPTSRTAPGLLTP